jgi:hypothetical protein
MVKVRELALQARLIPSGIAFRAEKESAQIGVDAVYFPAERMKVTADFGSDEARRSRDENTVHWIIGPFSGIDALPS